MGHYAARLRAPRLGGSAAPLPRVVAPAAPPRPLRRCAPAPVPGHAHRRRLRGSSARLRLNATERQRLRAAAAPRMFSAEYCTFLFIVLNNKVFALVISFREDTQLQLFAFIQSDAIQYIAWDQFYWISFPFSPWFKFVVWNAQS
jgi:hypothetical protein